MKDKKTPKERQIEQEKEREQQKKLPVIYLSDQQWDILVGMEQTHKCSKTEAVRRLIDEKPVLEGNQRKMQQYLRDHESRITNLENK